MKTKFYGVIFSFFMFSGCASQMGWTPTIDTLGDAQADSISQDLAECKELANQASKDKGKKVTEETLKGGAVGGATGAAIGAALGDAGEGAAIGAVAGGIGGAIKQGLSEDENFKEAYRTCMRNRGHNVIN